MMRLLAVLVLALIVSGSAAILARPDEASGSKTASLPSSLDALYPPKAPAPALLLAMHEVNQPLAGIVVDLNEGDRDGMTANYERFKAQYQKVSGLVPEWQDRFPTEPVRELGAAVQGGDPGAVMAAVEKVGAACHQCHAANMVPVQQRYHWPDFKMIPAHDPLSDRDLDFVGLMQMMNTTFSGIAVDLEQGQPDNARKQWKAFAALFGSMKDTCEACHDTERRYYVDSGMQAVVDQLGEALSSPQIDPGTVGELSRRIGAESCTACHMVHLPAAYSGQLPH